MNINDKNIRQEVFESDIPVVLDFYSDTCMPCKMLSPVLDDLGKLYKDKLKICKLNVNENSQLADEYGVMAVPTLMYVKNGREINRTIGFINKNEILEHLNL